MDWTDEANEHDAFLEKTTKPIVDHKNCQKREKRWIWVNIALSILVVAQFMCIVALKYKDIDRSSYAKGFDTDLGTATTLDLLPRQLTLLRCIQIINQTC